MHNGMITSTGADQDDQLVHDSSYSGAPWFALNSHGQMPISSYSDEYYAAQYITPHPTHGLPSESLGGHMGPSPFPQNIHHNNYGTQLPPPPIIPTQGQVPWPSLQTNPSQSYHHAPVTIPPAPAPVRQQPKLPTINTSQPRRTLTDHDRREMCKYADENPGVKQHDIGVKFGVERSTVSKVLRKKDHYLNQDDRSGSPIKRNKGKSPPDIERALANWVRGQVKKGNVVSDIEMEERAKVFCAGSDSSLKTITATWIEKFKQKHGIGHGIGHGRLIRRASETAIPDSTRLDRLDTESPIVSTSQTPSGISPASPAAKESPLISSASTKADDKDGHTRFSFATSGYKNSHSQSTASLGSAITDPPSSTISQGAFSPTFTFSPDPNSGLFGESIGNNSGFHRPRSHTVPNVPPIEYINPSETTEPQTPKYSVAGTGPSSAIESPAHELPAPTYGLDSAISPRTLHHVSSSGSLAGRSTASAGLGSTPTSPTQEDARRAVDTLLNYTNNNSYFDQHDYLLFLNIMEKWGIGVPQHNVAKANSAMQGLGGLSRIPEGDSEMANSASPNYKNEPPI
ncbi:hypothetical protein F5Y16DRAFT_181679 [Xylariaceae sp. FL0255]|nr:hypothetical protein F5Y16DRAFT_181679 [Xylariaceae sp. FL0255]